MGSSRRDANDAGVAAIFRGDQADAGGKAGRIEQLMNLLAEQGFAADDGDRGSWRLDIRRCSAMRMHVSWSDVQDEAKAAGGGTCGG